MSRCVNVAVSGAAFRFDKLYTYAVPREFQAYAVPGARVLVPFGGGAARMGVVLSESESGETGLKKIIDIERGEPLLGGELVALVFLLKKQTLCGYYDAVSAVIPKRGRLSADLSEDGAEMTKPSSAHLETAYVKSGSAGALPLTAKQKTVLAVLEQPLTFSEIRARAGVSRDIVKRLVKMGAAEEVKREKAASAYRNYEFGGDYSLTAAQQKACDEIRGFMAGADKPGVTLLHGVTGSGKTLIYCRLINDAVSAGRTALLLVPEIALATQLIYRFKALFGEKVGVIHSGLSDTERHIQWRRIKSGECSVVIGTRSAVFAPLEEIGIIIADEEQEQTYLSEQNPRYHALTVARFRADYHGAHLLLSSATPSIETYHAAVTGRYNFVSLKERYMDMPLPKVTITDMRGELLAGNGTCVSEYLKSEIDKRLEKREQVILLLNRRGYRTVSICSSCKTVVKCKSCDAALVYHKVSDKYICHYCGRAESFGDVCGVCGGNVRHAGIGTQKIEEELGQLFPAAKILRLDIDSTSGKNAAERKIRAFAEGEFDIIVGTQIVAKGLDFKGVTLVGVLSVDQLLLTPSFRAGERAFSMLTQVVGRSGRGEKAGEAVIQTVDPENPIIRLAAGQDYSSFYKSEIVSRKLHLYPPFCSVGSAGFTGEKEEETALAAREFMGILETGVKESGGAIPIRLLGPSPMRVSYVSDMYRYKITMKSRGDSRFRDMVFSSVEAFNKLKISKKVKVYVNFYDDSDS